MVKFRMFYDKDAETVWLNELAAQGFAMTRFFAGFYWFEKCEPGKYTYQVDFSDKLFRVSEDYREFMQEMEVEIIQTWGFWVILRRLTDKGEFKLYTDVESSIEHYSKIRKMFQGALLIEIICFFLEMFAAVGGNRWAYAFMFLIGAILVAFINAISKTNRVINELQERKGEQPSKNSNRTVSPLVPCGLLLNSCALVLEEGISHPIKLTIQIVAIICMLVGVYQTAQFQRKQM